MARIIFTVISALLLFSTYAAADTQDTFDYVKFNERALTEMDGVFAFYEDLAGKPGIVRTLSVYGISFVSIPWPVTSERDLPKEEIEYVKYGIQEIRDCIVEAKLGNDKDLIKEVWDEITSTSFSTTQFKCPKDLFHNKLMEINAAKIASRSNIAIRRYSSEIDNGFYYVPTLAALIHTYRTRGVFTDPVMEERIANTNLEAAQKRKKLGESDLDFMYLKYRYGTEPEVRPFVAETTLSKEDREGIRLVARCINSPLNAMVAYARIPAIPEENILLKHFSCLSSSPMALVSTWDKSAKLIELQGNFARAAKAALGMNVFMASENPGGTSLALDTIRASTEKDRLTARMHLILTDRFINEYIPAQRRSLATRPSYRDIGSLDAPSRYLLTDVLQQRFNNDNKDRIQNLAWYLGWLESIEGANSCYVESRNAAAAAGVGEKIFSMVKASTGGRAGKILKPIGMLITGGFAYFSWSKAAKEHKQAIKDFMEGKSTISKNILEACKLVSDGLEIKTTMKSFWTSSWGSDAYLKNIESKSHAGLADFLKTQTNEAVNGVVSKYVIKSAVEKKPEAAREAAIDWKKIYSTKSNNELNGIIARQAPLGVFYFKIRPATPAFDVLFFDDAQNDDRVTEYQLFLIKRALILGSGLDLTGPFVEIYSEQLKTLAQQAKSADLEAAKKAKTEIASKKKDALAVFFDSSFADDRLLLLESPGSSRLVYLPKNPVDSTVPAEIETQFKTFKAALAAAGLEDAAFKPHPDNYYIATLSDYLTAAASLKTETERFAVYKDLFSPTRVLGGGAHAKARSLQVKKSVLEAVRHTAGSTNQAAFDEILKTVFDTATLGELPGGIEKALANRRQKIDSATKGYDGDYTGKLLLLFDSRIAGLDLFGKDAQMVLEIALAPAQKEGKALNAYISKVATGAIRSQRIKDASDASTPLLEEKQFNALFKDYAGISGDSLELFKAMNEKLPADFLAGLRSAYSNPGLTARDRKNVRVVKTGESDTKSSAVIEVGLADGKKAKFILTTGQFGTQELEATKKWSESGAMFRTHAAYASGSLAIIFQEQPEKFQAMDKYLSSATATEKQAALEDAAELDALLGLSFTQTGSVGTRLYPLVQDAQGSNLVVLEKPKEKAKNTGRVALLRFDGNVATLRGLSSWLYLALLQRSVDFPEGDYSAYLKKLHAVFLREGGTAAGAEFTSALAETSEMLGKGTDAETLGKVTNQETLEGTKAQKTAFGTLELTVRVVGQAVAEKAGLPDPGADTRPAMKKSADAILASIGAR